MDPHRSRGWLIQIPTLVQIRPLEALLQSLRHLQAGPRVLQSRAPRLKAHFLAQMAGGAAAAATAGNGEEETDDEWAEKKKDSAPRQANGGEGALAVHVATACLGSLLVDLSADMFGRSGCVYTTAAWGIDLS